MDILDIHRIVDIAKQLNPQIQVLVCAESKEEAEVIRRENIGEFLCKRRNGEEYEHHILHQIELAHHQLRIIKADQTNKKAYSGYAFLAMFRLFIHHFSLPLIHLFFNKPNKAA
jgi:hypothetical protein